MPVSLIAELEEGKAILLAQLPQPEKPARKAKGKAPAVEKPPAELPSYLARIPILKGGDIPDEVLYPSEPADANAIAGRCPQMRAMRDKQGRLIEPLWRANVINLSYCKDGNEIAHDWSKGDPRYDREQTQGKIDRAKVDIAAPITCEFFQGNDPEQKCKACQFRDKITTPVQLGRDPWKQVTVEHRPAEPPKPAEAPSATIEAPAAQAAAPEARALVRCACGDNSAAQAGTGGRGECSGANAAQRSRANSRRGWRSPPRRRWVRAGAGEGRRQDI